MIRLKDGHHASDDLHRVHIVLQQKYMTKKRAIADEEKAKTMENYLRIFKAIGNQHDDKIQFKIQSTLQQQAIELIAAEVGNALGIGTYSLFRNEHLWYRDSSRRWGADDVFEAELAKLLEIAGREATGESINLGVSLIGGQTGNVNQTGIEELLKIPDELAKASLKNGQKLAGNLGGGTKIISPPTFRSAKVDVTGYKAEYIIGAAIKPEWQNFIDTFTGATFTVKNYSSRSANEVIHIGNSDLYKAFYGTLTDTLNFQPRDAAHIYYHTINTPIKGDMGEHIIHIRFTYELTGNGLYDQDGNKLDNADFFIYNDPNSNNIWVRSTKAMIASIMDYVATVRDPLHSGIVILKQSFA